MKKSLSTVLVLLICLIFCGLVGCGTGDDETPDINTLDGFWKFNSHKSCDGEIEYAEDENFEAYLKVKDGLAYLYIFSEGVGYYCTDVAEGWGEDITNGDYIIDNNMLVHSFYEDDDDNSATPDCLVTDYFEKSDETIIDDAVEDCIIYDQID